MRSVFAYIAIATAYGLGAGSLLLFGYFLFGGALAGVVLAKSEIGRLAWDGVLSMLFFVQHSAMVRQSVRTRLSRVIPEWGYSAAYAIASGTALLLVVLLWQHSEIIVYRLDGPLRWLSWLVTVLVMAGFAWGVKALGGLDLFGTVSICRHLRANRPQVAETAAFVVAGPYRYVRHPLYFLVLVLFWCTPVMSLDRLLFNILWSGWIIVGTVLEERGLAREFGSAYREYQQRVPMLLPWRTRPPSVP